MRRHGRLWTAALLAVAGLGLTAAAPAPIDLPDRAFPESIAATRDGTFYVPNLLTGGILRIRKGKTEQWVAPGAFGSRSIYGVFADERTGILWACSNDLSRYGGTALGDPGSAIKGFDLKTGQGRVSAAFPPGRAECNDFAVGPDGAVYVSDTGAPRILRLAKGETVLKVWATDPRFDQKGNDTDGIAFGDDGNLYVNTLGASQIFRITLDGDRPGTITALKASRPIDGTDGMRHLTGQQFVMVEGSGRLSRVTVKGDEAIIEPLKEGLEEPTSVAVVGHTAWVAEGRLSYVFEKARRSQTPPAFHLQPVPLP